jgi:hypothetical protein
MTARYIRRELDDIYIDVVIDKSGSYFFAHYYENANAVFRLFVALLDKYPLVFEWFQQTHIHNGESYFLHTIVRMHALLRMAMKTRHGCSVSGS